MKPIPILLSLAVCGAAALRQGLPKDDDTENVGEDSSILASATLQLRGENDLSRRSTVENGVSTQNRRRLGKSSKSKSSKSKAKASKSKDAGNGNSQALSSEVPNNNNNDVGSDPSDSSDASLSLEDVAWGAIAASIVAGAQDVSTPEQQGGGSGGGLDAIAASFAGAAQEILLPEGDESDESLVDDDWESWLIPTLPPDTDQSTKVFSFGTEKFDENAPNAALGKPSTASSEARPSSNAFDGDLNTTRWASDVSLNETQSYLQVDLGEDHAISSVVIHWDYASATSYDIQVSLDGVWFTTVWSKTNGEADMGTVESYLGGIIVRYVRMVGLAAATSLGYRIWEMEVFGTAVITDD